MEPISDVVLIVRRALRHLYDPNALRSNPLVTLLGLEDERNPAKRLREMLIAAIEAMEPDQATPEQSKAWRMYEILLYRYVQQSGQSEVATQLGISERHLRREENEAIRALAYVLAPRFSMRQTPVRNDHQIVAQAVASLHSKATHTAVFLDAVLPGVFTIVRPLAEMHRVRLHQPDLAWLRNICVCIEKVALRQILINLFSIAIRQSPLGSVGLETFLRGATVWLKVSSGESLERVPLNQDDVSILNLTRDLVQAVNGEFRVSLPEEPFEASVALPATGAVNVLVIDDNADMLDLLQRYALNSRYRIYPLAQPEQALEFAQRIHPHIIVLDVMMPSVDGWEIMGRLRQHPDTCCIPLVVCTILAQEELARALGASAFLHKPVTRQAFLAALDQQVEAMGLSSR